MPFSLRQCAHARLARDGWIHELLITATARRQLAEGLPASIEFAAYEFIIGPLLDNLQRVGTRLMPRMADRHSARLGTYRVVYRIDDVKLTVTVLAVSPRVDAYRTR